jgi:hypothetical protein
LEVIENENIENENLENENLENENLERIEEFYDNEDNSESDDKDNAESEDNSESEDNEKEIMDFKKEEASIDLKNSKFKLVLKFFKFFFF